MRTNSPITNPQSNAAKGFAEPVLGRAGTRSRPLRVLHVLSVSLPHINGYALRSKYIVETQAESALVEPIVVTSPFYPGQTGTAEDAVINGIPYYRVANPQDESIFDNPRLLPFTLLHWAKNAVDWSIPFLRRKRRQALRIARKIPRFVRRRVKRIIRYTLRVAVCGYRVLVAIGHLIAVMIEPVVGKRFLPAVKVFAHWAAVGLWLLSRPFSVATQKVSRRLRPAMIAARRFVRRLLGSRVVVPDPDHLPLRRRLMTLLQNWEKSLLLQLFERKLVEYCRTFRPDVIHVHSPYFCGVPAVKAGKKQKIPVVYEVRGIWEESGVAQGNFKRDSDQYRKWRRNETWAMTHADAVTCICEQLRKEIISRDVDPERVFVAPNAVDAGVFVPASHSGAKVGEIPELVKEVRQRLGKRTIGYIGSIRPLEGVDGLVRGAARVIRRGYDATLLVVGGGADVDQLRELAEELGIADRVIFTGQVPHDEVHFYYELIDIFVISRPASRVAKLVTPLKPLEAMAMEKALIVSDLPALRELVADGHTGLVYEAEDPSDLAGKCIRLIEDDELRERLATTARQWVRDERSWRHAIVPQLEAYATVVPSFESPAKTFATAREAA